MGVEQRASARELRRGEANRPWWFKTARAIHELPLWTEYVLASGMVLLSLFARSAVIGDREAYHLYVFFMPAILLASTVLRHGGGILAVLLSAVLIKAFYIPPLWSAWVNDPDDAVAIVVFIGSGLVTAVMGSALHGMVQEMQHLRAFSLVLDVRHQDKARRSSCRSNRSPAGPSCNTGKLGGAALVTLRAMQSERFEPHGHIGSALTVLLPYRITRQRITG